ncbi:hypothetical protein [[Clostridium] polysaccharolyticum]|uniref:Uncharacterized protein n=1 Tax=[Clostridium] polysaccharolyticum TaxID=29364 RepID=A0A1I0C3F7_9FIRM|nr:hypothetical protein [[Clostridium] polysaccharolyticum]SET14016.1 hypothetical protein SAMN04487772_1095 [[Clostridium] polysaccharolyticum]
MNYLQQRMASVDLNPGVKPWLGILEEEYRYRVGLSYDWLVDECYKKKTIKLLIV